MCVLGEDFWKLVLGFLDTFLHMVFPLLLILVSMFVYQNSVTQYHRHGGLNNRNLFSQISGF